MKATLCIGLVLLPLFCVSTLPAVETMNGIFAEGMVLQQQMSAPIFGTADPGQKITVTFRGDSVNGTADTQGKWQVKIPSKTAGGPFPLTIKGGATRTIQEVWVGEVWLAGGQSNVNVGLDATQQAQVTDNNNIHIYVAPGGDATPRNWTSIKAGQSYPALGYFFAKEIQKARNVPIGIVFGAKGATTMSNWLTWEAFISADSLLTEWWAPGYIGLNKKNIIVPLQPYGIKGVIWHQGEFESDADNFNTPVIPDMTSSFEKMFRALIAEWRADWGQGDFPWLFVQMEWYFPKPAPEDNRWAKVREAQRRVSLGLPNVGMATIIDAGLGLHPEYKDVHAMRLSKIARAKVYGEQIEYSGPMVERVTRSGDSLNISFLHANGLFATKVADFTWPAINFAAAARTDSVSHMEVQSAGGAFVSVPAIITGQRVALNVKNMSSPLTVRYAYRNNPNSGNLLYNSDTLPASPFVATEGLATKAGPAEVVRQTKGLSIKVAQSKSAVTFYGLPVQGTVGIYSLDGKRVRDFSIADGGIFQWNYTDNAGMRVSRGSYYLFSGESNAHPVRIAVW